MSLDLNSEITQNEAPPASNDTTGASTKDSPPSPDNAEKPVVSNLPDGIPDAFLKDGNLNIDALKSIADKQASDSERLKDIPENGEYKVTLSEDLKDAEGKQIEIDTSSHEYSTLIEIAKVANLTQTQVNEIANKFVKSQYEALIADQKAQVEKTQEDLKQLGENYKVRIEKVAKAIDAQIGETSRKAIFAATPPTADAVKALEALVAKVTAISPNPAPLNENKAPKSGAEIFYGKK